MRNSTDSPKPVTDGTDILKHYEEYGILICKPCEFAIQPSALASHLLKHQIYRSERRKLLSRLSHLKLKDPDDVVDPPALSEPIPELHVYKGARCLHPATCDHICASEKRMAQHWSIQHGERESRNVKSRPAWLQTFFRGNKIRYFEVSGPVIGSPASTDGSTHDSTPLDKTILSNLPASLDMEALRYLLHFTENTAFTLPRTESESAYFWSSIIPHEALSHPFLMYGLLGLSAYHLGALSTEATETERHLHASARYQEASLFDFRDLAQRPDQSNAVALIAYSRMLGIQRCGNREYYQGWDLKLLVDFMHLVRGSIETLISLQTFLPDYCDFKLPIQELEDLGALDDERLLTRDAESVGNIPKAMLERLDSLPHRITQVMPLPTLDKLPEVQACMSANTALIAAYARAYSSPTPNSPPSGLFVGSADSETIRAVWAGIESWTRHVSDLFIHLIEEGNEPALIICAHFCVLVGRFEDRYWYMKGIPERIITLIEANLGEPFKPFVSDMKDILK